MQQAGEPVGGAVAPLRVTGFEKGPLDVHVCCSCEPRRQAGAVQRVVVAEESGCDQRLRGQVGQAGGEFVWHTDELFLVISGWLTIQLRDTDVVLEPGELFVVPRGVEHCPVADEETAILLFEPAGKMNTGDAGGPMTKVARTSADGPRVVVKGGFKLEGALHRA
ncbi:cupin domain-containing protein [Saccharopolyspora sp. NPDC002376]